jgi:hypothetical protein
MKTSITIIGLALIAAFSSCRKTIDIQVADADKKYVIEGNITDQSAPATVRITRSISLNAANEFPEVNGAEVSIKDLTLGTQYQLVQSESGTYQSAAVKGVPGHQYQLLVSIGGEKFVAQSVMPAAVNLDSIYIEKTWFGTEVKGIYRDPAAVRNYYHYVITRAGQREKGNMVSNDESNDGHIVTTSMIAVNDTLYRTGDQITATLESIDPAVYQYYYGLAISADQSTSAPANPKSNISGGALGYFSAHTVSSKSLVFP